MSGLLHAGFPHPHGAPLSPRERGRGEGATYPVPNPATNPDPQRGFALLAILVVVSLVTALAVGLAHSSLVRLSALERRQEAAQAWQVWRAGLEWARDILAEDARRGAVDHPGEPWARGLRDYPAEGGLLTGRVEDQQGLFNLNNLVRNGRASEADLALFRRLLSRLGLDEGLAGALADWIDADRLPQPGGAEDSAYVGLHPPNRPLQHMAELYRVRGFDAAAVERLRPYVAVLPEAVAINVNSAPPEVLAALLPGLSEADVTALTRARPFADLAAFRAALPTGTSVGTSVDAAAIQFRSRYFLLRQTVGLGRVRAEGEALLDRSAGLPVVVWQARGLPRPLRVDNPLGAAEMGSLAAQAR